MTYDKIQAVTIVGGVHGNERTGVEVIRALDQTHLQQAFPQLTCQLLTGNPQAIAANQRYIDHDLNRCFRPSDLANARQTGYEFRRARRLAQQIQAFGTDIVIDLHTTTAAMGTTLILNQTHPLLLNLAAWLLQQNPDIRILQYASQAESPYLRGLCPLGLTIELGPVPQRQIVPQAITTTQNTLWQILTFLQTLADGIPLQHHHCTIYQQVETVDYPRDAAGKITGSIAPQIKDFQALQPGTPLFYNRKGQVTLYRGTTTVYPVFIGEAAYVEKGIAMALTQRKDLVV